MPPTAANDSYGTAHNTPLVVPAPGVLGNDSANGGGTMTAVLDTTVSVAAGTLALSPTGGFTYTPATGFSGPATFTYHATTTNGPGNIATVTIAVAAAPPPPTAVADSYATAFNTVLTVAAPGVLGNDSANGGGTMTAVLTGTAANGTLVLSADGGFAYTPNAGFAGTDTFSYRASTVAGGASTVAAAATIVVAQPTDPQPPTNLRVTRMSGNTVTFGWLPPTLGPQATGYLIEGGLAPGEVVGQLPLGAAPTFTITLPTGSFFLRVRTLAGGATSAVSNELLTHVNVSIPPSAPANLLGLVVGDTLNLVWTTTFGGGAPTNVILDVTGPVNGSAPLGLTDSFSFAGVPAGIYTLSVRAVNASGSSVASNPVTLTFPTACSGAPQPVANFVAYKNDGILWLNWDSPATGTAPTSYLLNVTGAFVGSIPTPLKALSGAVPAGTYNFSVVATNTCGSSAPTPVQSVTIP